MDSVQVGKSVFVKENLGIRGVSVTVLASVGKFSKFRLNLKAKCVLGFEFPRDDKSSDLRLTKVNSLKCFPRSQKKEKLNISNIQM